MAVGGQREGMGGGGSRSAIPMSAFPTPSCSAQSRAMSRGRDGEFSGPCRHFSEANLESGMSHLPGPQAISSSIISFTHQCSIG